jgi:two-component system, cell cycle sensor histidine kinase and response regulator CckA
MGSARRLKRPGSRARTARGRSAPALPAVEGLLDAILGEPSLERALETALPAIAAPAGAEAAAIFVFDDRRPVLERWHPLEWTPPAALAERVRSAAHALFHPQPENPKPHPAGWRLLPLLAKERTVGVLCLGPRRGRATATEPIERLTRVLACRVAGDLEMDRSRALQARYERWFKTLDEQVRVLDRERQKFAAVVHASDASVFVTDPARVIRWTNSVMAQWPPAEHSTWRGLTCRDVCSAISAQGHQQECDPCPVAAALARKEVVHREFHRSGEGGEVRSHYLTALPIKGPDGSAAEAMVMVQDLSDLEILRSSEARYRQVFERSTRGIVMVDPDDRTILLANASARRITGHDEELRGQRLQDLHADSEWQRLEPHYEAAFRGGELGMMECRLRTRDGSERLAMLSGARTDFDGRLVLMLDFHDITEERRVQLALQQAEVRLRRVIASAPIILFALDQHGRFTLSEGRGLAGLGLVAGQRIGMSVFEIYRDDPTILGYLRRALAGEEFSVVAEVGDRAFETNYAPVRGPDGSLQEVIGVATDVTERHKLEERLRQAQRMEAIGRLAGGVAHDFNNLLAAIMGHSELIMTRLEPGHPMWRSAEEVQKAAVRGAMLTRQLLAFGRKDMLTLQVLDLNTVVSGMDGMLRRLIGEDIELVSVAEDVVSPVRADRGQLEQVIMNLAVNARDAMPHGGKLTIGVERVTYDEAQAQRIAQAKPGPHVILTIADTGVGMDEETLAHAFEPFYTTKPRDKGTGLGLATVYGIVEQCGGHIQLTSEPGVGTRFEVALPLVDASELTDGESPAQEPADGGRETILLAEDEDAVRALARETLEGKGYRVLEARNGVEALATARSAGWIDLLVTDVVMPQMGGGELARQLQAERPGIKVLFISGYPDDALVRHGVLEGSAPLLPKPFSLTEFARKVREILDAAARKAA